jgi:hypothetical protein
MLPVLPFALSGALPRRGAVGAAPLFFENLTGEKT